MIELCNYSTEYGKDYNPCVLKTVDIHVESIIHSIK